jgi:2'-5' RNA ligase
LQEIPVAKVNKLKIMFDPKDSKTIGYHLFLLPQGELFDNFQTIITDFAKKYQGPVFEPHVTLLARIPKADEAGLIDKTKKLAAMMQPFEISLEQVEAQDTYFRALYCKAEVNPELTDYHQKALEMFDVEDVNTYFPHLSLYYGNLARSAKDEMISSLKLPMNMKFLVDRVYLYRTEGEAQDWVSVGAYKLG